MSNYYTQASVGIYTGKDVAKATLQEYVDAVKKSYEEDEEWGDTPFMLSVEPDTEDGGHFLWLRHDESLDVDEACYTIQLAMKEFKIVEPITLSFACICSKPELGGFGGGLIVITQDDIKDRRHG